jgi:hypothetical protein
MLRRAENVSVAYQGDFWSLFSGKGTVLLRVGRKVHASAERYPKARFYEDVHRAFDEPVFFMRVAERQYWCFEDNWYWDNDDLTSEEVRALLVTREQRRRASISRAKTMVAMANVPPATVRGVIPADIKQLVWQRDGGACRDCGSNTELQFDHMIPISMGGASTETNLQILCGPCNRRKGASV